MLFITIANSKRPVRSILFSLFLSHSPNSSLACLLMLRSSVLMLKNNFFIKKIKKKRAVREREGKGGDCFSLQLICSDGLTIQITLSSITEGFPLCDFCYSLCQSVIHSVILTYSFLYGQAKCFFAVPVAESFSSLLGGFRPVSVILFTLFFHCSLISELCRRRSFGLEQCLYRSCL